MSDKDKDEIKRLKDGLEWIALGIHGRQKAVPSTGGQPFTDWELAKLVLAGDRIWGIVSPTKVG